MIAQNSLEQIDDESLVQVYRWATQSRGEQNLYDTDYLWSDAALALKNRLQRTRGNLILVVAKQGAGKTSLCNQLPWVLSEDGTSLDDKTLYFKWTGNEDLIEIAKIKPIQYHMKLFNRLIDEYSFNDLQLELDLSNEETNIARKIFNDKSEEIPDDSYKLFTSNFITRMEKLAGKALIVKEKKSLFDEEIEKYRNLIIDTADFNKTKTNELDHHIKQIQELWNTIYESYNEYDTDYNLHINIVVFLQQEIYDKYRHFFIGKFKPVYFIEPFKPLSLVNFYKHKFDSTGPFTPEALIELAVLSRGIFRRFKTYIGICLDNMNVTMTPNTDNNSSLLLEKNLNIDIERGIGRERREGNSESKNVKESTVIVTLNDVQEWIKDKILIQDLELELHNVFPKQKGLRNITVQLLRRLAHGSLKQSQIALEYFDGYEKGASRFLMALEENEYITRSYIGKDKFVSLSFWEIEPKPGEVSQ